MLRTGALRPLVSWRYREDSLGIEKKTMQQLERQQLVDLRRVVPISAEVTLYQSSDRICP
jgi:hypothetical protein